MVNSVDCLSPSLIARDDFTLRFRASTAGGEAPSVRARARACVHMVGRRGRFRAQRMGETRETPRTAHAPAAESVGFLNRRRQNHPSRRPLLPSLLFSFLRPAASDDGGGGGGWFLVGALSPWKGVHRSHARRYSLSLPLSLSPPPLPLFTSRAPSLSLRLRCVCLFIVAFWEIPDTSNGVSYARHAVLRRSHSHSGVASGRFSDSSETSRSGRIPWCDGMRAARFRDPSLLSRFFSRPFSRYLYALRPLSSFSRKGFFWMDVKRKIKIRKRKKDVSTYICVYFLDIVRSKSDAPFVD